MSYFLSSEMNGSLASSSSAVTSSDYGIRHGQEIRHGNRGRREDVNNDDDEDDFLRAVCCLYKNGFCKWPDCDMPCDNIHSFLRYIDVQPVSYLYSMIYLAISHWY